MDNPFGFGVLLGIALFFVVLIEAPPPTYVRAFGGGEAQEQATRWTPVQPAAPFAPY